jgi:hypothetical protein
MTDLVAETNTRSIPDPVASASITTHYLTVSPHVGGGERCSAVLPRVLHDPPP